MTDAQLNSGSVLLWSSGSVSIQYGRLDVHSSTPQIFIGRLWCTRLYAENQWYRVKKTKQNLPFRAYSRVAKTLLHRSWQSLGGSRRSWWQAALSRYVSREAFLYGVTFKRRSQGWVGVGKVGDGNGRGEQGKEISGEATWLKSLRRERAWPFQCQNSVSEGSTAWTSHLMFERLWKGGVVPGLIKCRWGRFKLSGPTDGLFTFLLKLATNGKCFMVLLGGSDPWLCVA